MVQSINPAIPVDSQTKPVIPPNQRLPFINPETGILTPYGMQFLQQVFASLQVNSGPAKAFLTPTAGLDNQTPGFVVEGPDGALISVQPVSVGSTLIEVDSVGDPALNYSRIELYRARGTVESQTSPLSGDALGSFQWFGNGAPNLSCFLVVTAGENFDATHGAGRFAVSTITQNGGETLAERLFIDAADGHVHSNSLLLTAGYTVATLPTASAALAGARSYVTDATAPVFLGALVGGGAVVCPVFCRGASGWVAG